MEVLNARVKAQFLGLEDHGILTHSLTLDLGGRTIGFGGYDLRGPFASVYIEKLLATFGARDLAALTGAPVRVEFNDDRQIHRIGHFIEDSWFCPKHDVYDAFATAQQDVEPDPGEAVVAKKAVASRRKSGPPPYVPEAPATTDEVKVEARPRVVSPRARKPKAPLPA